MTFYLLYLYYIFLSLFFGIDYFLFDVGIKSIMNVKFIYYEIFKISIISIFINWIFNFLIIILIVNLFVYRSKNNCTN